MYSAIVRTRLSIQFQKGIYRFIGGRNSQAGTTFHAHPILVSQDGTGSKKRLKGRLTGSVQGTE
jgi:hypothetical protein